MKTFGTKRMRRIKALREEQRISDCERHGECMTLKSLNILNSDMDMNSFTFPPFMPKPLRKSSLNPTPPVSLPPPFTGLKRAGSLLHNTSIAFKKLSLDGVK